MLKEIARMEIGFQFDPQEQFPGPTAPWILIPVLLCYQFLWAMGMPMNRTGLQAHHCHHHHHHPWSSGDSSISTTQAITGPQAVPWEKVRHLEGRFRNRGHICSLRPSKQETGKAESPLLTGSESFPHLPHPTMTYIL